MRQPSTSPWLDVAIVGIAWAVLVFFVFVGFLIYSASRPVRAHGFYPGECCSNRDCAPLSAVRVHPVVGGYLIDGLHFVFESQTRVSPDGKYHGCFPTPDTLLCFFAPKPSM